ncbi:MAG TPA: hypothetical protein DHV48_03145 [Prolixibacteraceae bacterium]|nr:hypothetical protein [Prolixibacteraceae bacterium]
MEKERKIKIEKRVDDQRIIILALRIFPRFCSRITSAEARNRTIVNLFSINRKEASSLKI